MKHLLVSLCLACTAGVLLVQALPQGGTYTTKYDSIDLDAILSNDRLYKKYFDCLTNKGKCTPEGQELKNSLPEALATQCKKCSAKQKAGSERVLRYLIEKRPNDWAVLEKLYDPQGNYRARYKAEAAKRGVKV